MALSATQNETMSQFVMMTGAETSVAKLFLQATSWDLNTAIDRFYAFDGDSSKLAPPKNMSQSNHQSQQLYNPSPANMMSSTASVMQQALSGLFGGGGNSNNNHNVNPQSSASSSSHSNLSQTDQDALMAQQLAAQSNPSQPYVRAPDATFQDQLVGPYTNQYGSSIYKQRMDAKQNFSKDWQKGPKNQKSSFLGALFSDPTYKFMGSLEDAKKRGHSENKWVLVNIQDTENFTAHCLNRDVWKDKELKPVIMEQFIFYQWQKKTDNAKRIINLYHPQSFPCIFILDPATGRKEHEFAVPQLPDKVINVKGKILEFLDDFPNPKAKPKRVIPQSIASKDLAPQSHEDKLLQQAIAASMEEHKVESTNTNSNNEMDVDMNNDKEKEEVNNDEEEKEDMEKMLDAPPEATDPNATAIRMRMPNGSLMQRMFLKDAKVSQLYIWCRLSLEGRNVSLLQTMPRMKLDDEKEKTLKELGLIRATLVCSYLD